MAQATATRSGWMSVNDAAATLGVSAAVIRYQIIQGQVRSRLTENGKQVFIGAAAEKTTKARRWWKITTMLSIGLLLLGTLLVAGPLTAAAMG